MAAAFGNGTKKFFNMSAAPSGWTRDTATVSDHAIVITGIGSLGGTVGGTTNFTTVHPGTSKTITAGAIWYGNPTSPATIDLPSHTHSGTVSLRASRFFGTTETGYTWPYPARGPTAPRRPTYYGFVTAQNAPNYNQDDWSDAHPNTVVNMGNLIPGNDYTIAAFGTTTAAQWDSLTGEIESSTNPQYVYYYNRTVGKQFTAVNPGAGYGTGQVRPVASDNTHFHTTGVSGSFTNAGSKTFNLGVKYVDLILASKNGAYGATWLSQTATTVAKGASVSITWNTPIATVGPAGTSLYWTIINSGMTGALSSTTMSGSFATTGATTVQSITVTDNVVWDNGGAFIVQLRSDSTNGVILAVSQRITITEPDPTAVFISAVNPVIYYEGTAGTLSFTPTRLRNGELLTYNIYPVISSGISPSAPGDFLGSITTGQVAVNNNTVTINTNPIIDLLIENSPTPDSFYVTLSTRSGLNFADTRTSGYSLYIGDVPPTVTFTVIPTTVTVNTPGTFTITTTNVPNGTILTWEISGGLNFLGTFVNTTGTVYIYNNTGTFYITPNSVRDSSKAWNYADSPWTFGVIIKTSAGQTLQTSGLATVNNSTVTFVTPTTTFYQGQTVRYNITTTNIPNGTQLMWKIGWSFAGSDASFSAVQGYVTIDNNTGSFTISATVVNTPILFGYSQHYIDIYNFDGTFKLTGSRLNSTPVVYGAVITVYTTYPAIACKFITPPLSILEGTAATLEFESNISSGTLYWAINATPTVAADFTGSVVSGSVILNGATVLDSTNLNQRYLQRFTLPSTAVDILNESTETFTVSLRKDSVTGEVVGTSNIISIVNVSVTYTFDNPATVIDEGISNTYRINTTSVVNGTTLYWDIVTNPTSYLDFYGATFGSFTVNSNTGTFTITTVADAITEGDQTFTINIRTGGNSGNIVASSPTITITDTSLNPTYSFTSLPMSIDEGFSGSITFQTTSVNPGVVFYWSIDYINSTTISDFASVSGSFTTTGTFSVATGTFSILPILDRLTEGTESFTVSVRKLSLSEPIVATSGTIAIADISRNPTFTFSNTTTLINEGTSVNYNVSCTDVLLGTTLFWSINHITTSPADFVASSGTVVISNGSLASSSGTFTISSLYLDSATEGDETFSLQLRTGSGTDPVATSLTITLTNTVPNITYTFRSPALTISEGSTTTYTIDTTDVNIGTTLYYALNHITTTGSDFKLSSSSVYFDGSSYLTTPVNTTFVFGTGEFTIEAWIYSTNIGTAGAIFDNRIPDTRHSGFGFFISSSKLHFGTAGSNYLQGTTTLASNTWYHVALSRYTVSGEKRVRMFLNGMPEGPIFLNMITNFVNSTTRIGYGQNGYFNGYISNLRVVKGTGLYTTTFTPTGPLSGTDALLLLCQGPTVTSDNSNNSWSMSTVGSPTISTSITPPFPFSGIGSFVVDSGTAAVGTGSFNISTKTDSSFENNETFSLEIRSGLFTYTVLATSPTITIAINVT